MSHPSSHPSSRSSSQSGGITWHLPAEALERYSQPADGLDSAWASSVEAHLDQCAFCRSRLTPIGDGDLLARIGASLSARIEQTPQYPRPLRRRIHLTAGLPLTWLLGALAVTVMSGVLDATSPGPDNGRPSVLLLLAPVLPLIAVAAVWTPRLDPMHELTAATPSAGLALLLRRTLLTLLAVVLVSLGVSLLGGSAPATRWLLPSLTLTALALALGSLVRLHLAAFGLAALWGLAVVLPAVTRQHVPVLLNQSAAPVWGVVLALAVIAVTLQHNAYQRLSQSF